MLDAAGAVVSNHSLTHEAHMVWVHPILVIKGKRRARRSEGLVRPSDTYTDGFAAWEPRTILFVP